MLSRILKGVIWAIGLVVVALCIILFTGEISMVWNWTCSGFVLTIIDGGFDDVPVRFFSVDPGDFVAPSIPVNGDPIETIAGQRATRAVWITTLETRHEPGREVPITFRREGRIERTAIRSRAVAGPLRVSVIVLLVISGLLLLSYFGIGFWAFVKRPGSAAVRVMFLYCLSMATYMVTSYMPMFRDMGSFRTPFDAQFQFALALFGALFGSFWLLLHMLFPRPVAVMQRRPWLGYLLALLPWAAFPAGPIVLYVVVVAQVLLGLYLLWLHHVHAESHLERRQTKLVLLGSGPVLILFLLLLIERFGVLIALRRVPVGWRILLTDIIFGVLLLSPLSFAYAFGKYRLLEVEGRLRRGTQRVLALVLLLVVLFGVASVVNEFITRNLERGSLLNLLFTTALVIAVLRTAQSVEKIVQNRLYPERLRLRQMFQGFLQRATTLASKDDFWKELETSLRDALTLTGVHPVLRLSSGAVCFLREKERTPFLADCGILRELEATRRPMMVDELLSSSRQEVDEEQRAWLKDHDVALILPMIVHGHLIGFLGLGGKEDREDFTAEEMAILHSFAPQVALAIENLHLLEERVEKKRMQEELLVARRIQERFLPQSMPSTPGLEVAAHSIFCREVAGDYYDVMALPGGRTLIAVGDVSGKGAGAAMIMATVQASLRSMAKAGVSLVDLVTSLNAMILENTDSGRFVTLFVAVYDPAAQCLTYVNAGHNAPRIIHDDSAEMALQEGGTVLGFLPEASYKQDIARLGPDDLLVAFTDGVSEARSGGGEEFGERRIVDRVRSLRTSSPREIMAAVEQDVLAHRGAGVLEDDSTLLVAKATRPGAM